MYEVDYSDDNQETIKDKQVLEAVATRSKEIIQWMEDTKSNMPKELLSAASDRVLELKEKYPSPVVAMGEVILNEAIGHRIALELLPPEQFKEYLARYAAYDAIMTSGLKKNATKLGMLKEEQSDE